MTSFSSKYFDRQRRKTQNGTYDKQITKTSPGVICARKADSAKICTPAPQGLYHNFDPRNKENFIIILVKKTRRDKTVKTQ